MEKTWHFVIVTGRGGEPDFNVDAFMPPDRERDELYLQIVNLIRKVVAERGALMFQATNEKELGQSHRRFVAGGTLAGTARAVS